jgi:hypothetical protein
MSDKVLEPSGLVRSRRHPGVFWTHGDSGCPRLIHAISGDGTLVRSVLVEGGSCIDWEDIATDDKGYLFIADTGNNANRRRDLAIHRLPEPDLNKEASTARVDRSYRFRYADQKAYPDPVRLNFDAEAIFWARGELYLLTKHRGDHRTNLFRIPEEASEREVELLPIGSFHVGGEESTYGGMVTGADATQDGRYLAVLTYHALFVFERTEGQDPYLSNLTNRIDFDMGTMQQIESVAWDGWSVLIGNEDRELFRLANPFEKRTTRFP